MQHSVEPRHCFDQLSNQRWQVIPHILPTDFEKPLRLLALFHLPWQHNYCNHVDSTISYCKTTMRQATTNIICNYQKVALASSLDTFLAMLHYSHPTNNRNY